MNERTNERTNKQTNEQTNIRTYTTTKHITTLLLCSREKGKDFVLYGTFWTLGVMLQVSNMNERLKESAF